MIVNYAPSPPKKGHSNNRNATIKEKVTKIGYKKMKMMKGDLGAAKLGSFDNINQRSAFFF